MPLITLSGSSSKVKLIISSAELSSSVSIMASETPLPREDVFLDCYISSWSKMSSSSFSVIKAYSILLPLIFLLIIEWFFCTPSSSSATFWLLLNFLGKTDKFFVILLLLTSDRDYWPSLILSFCLRFKLVFATYSGSAFLTSMKNCLLSYSLMSNSSTPLVFLSTSEIFSFNFSISFCIFIFDFLTSSLSFVTLITAWSTSLIYYLKLSLSSLNLDHASSSLSFSLTICSESLSVSRDLSLHWMVEYYIFLRFSMLSRTDSLGGNLFPWNTFLVKYLWVMDSFWMIRFGSLWLLGSANRDAVLLFLDVV